MAVKARARSQETVTLKTELPHPVCSFRVFLSHPLSLSLSVRLVLSFRFIYSRYKLKEAVERHFGWYRKGISATAAGTRPDEKRPTRRMVFHRLPAALLAVRQCSETNDVLVVHLLHGRWRVGTSATTSITRRALTSLDASDPRAESRDTRGKKKRTRRTKVSLSQRFFPMKRCAVATEENKGTPAQQRPGWDYFADFTCYGSGYILCSVSLLPYFAEIGGFPGLKFHVSRETIGCSDTYEREPGLDQQRVTKHIVFYGTNREKRSEQGELRI